MLARSLQLLEKAKSALISAIEVYNKPDFKYREETFSILALNAWELLLKAKIVSDADNDPRAIYVYEKRRTKKGELSKKEYIKRNRVDNPYTKALSQLINELDRNSNTRLSPSIKSNIDALTEIRDNAVHFMNAGPMLSRRVLEIGTASVRNFIGLARKWFNVDLSEYSLYLLPIGFVVSEGAVKAISSTSDETNLLNYLEALIGNNDEKESGGYSVALEVNVSMKRSSTDSDLQVSVTDNPEAFKVQISDDDIRKAYPWDYEELTKRLRERYVDFKVNKKYHSIRKPLKDDLHYVKTRLLDPGNPNCSKKDFYSPNIFQKFDLHYTRR